MKYLWILLIIWKLCDTSFAQKAGENFVRIDSIYLDPLKKGRIEVGITRMGKDRTFAETPMNFSCSETFFNYENKLKITDLKQRPDTFDIIVICDHSIKIPQLIFEKVLDQINNTAKRNPVLKLNPIFIFDSLGNYKYEDQIEQYSDTIKLFQFLNKPYSVNLIALHKFIRPKLANSVIVGFTDESNISRIDVAISRITGIKDIKYQINQAPLIFPYLIDEITIPEYLKSYILKTDNPNDRIITDPNLTRFHRNFQKIIIANFEYKYTLTLDTKKPNYKGEERKLSIVWMAENKSDTLSYAFGSSDYPLNIKELNKDWIFWLSALFFGILFLLAIFFVLSIFYPQLEEKRFYKKYVSPYFPVNNIVKLDTMTNEPIEKGTLVVTKCKEIVPYYIWKGLGNQCPSYPECMDFLGCDGCGKSEINYKFFSQSGNMKKFNWLFYGACGGFIAWIVSLLIIPVLNGIEFGSLFSFLYDKSSFQKTDPMSFKINSIHQSAVGLGIGFGLGAALIMADYFSSIIRPKVWWSVARIILCALLTAIAFGFIYSISYSWGLNPFLSGIISWTFFALILSLSITFFSPTINYKRAILASSAGIISSFLIYHFISELTNIGYEDFSGNRQLFIEFIKIFRFILCGALTGYIVTNVINKMEEYELTLLSPEQVSGRVIPISKILNSRTAVTIGSSPKNVIFIKWTDPGAEESHASISLTNEGVLLTAHAEIIINKEYLSKGSKHLLKDKEVIQLGRHSSTLMSFNVKYS